jgi:uncharacterized membrane protein YphA (DoxX/SURF4 family)
MSKLKNYGPWIAITLVAIYIAAGGVAKLMGVPQVHQSFATLGLPAWFGYFIGTCEILGAIALFTRRFSALAAAGLGFIMVGALCYHATYTPVSQALPALLLLVLCGYIFFNRRIAHVPSA